MNPGKRSASAFSLVEVALALGVAAFALIAIFGLLPVGLNSNQSSIRQSDVANVLSDIVSDLRSTGTSATAAVSSPRLVISLPLSGSSMATTTYYMNSGGGPYPATQTISTASQYRVVITVTPPPAAVGPLPPTRTATQVGIVISWPASAATNPAGSVSSFLALDRN